LPEGGGVVGRRTYYEALYNGSIFSRKTDNTAKQSRHFVTGKRHAEAADIGTRVKKMLPPIWMYWTKEYKVVRGCLDEV
jgi:hypothetical protein